MSITYPLAIPTTNIPNSVIITLGYVVAASVSPFTKQEQRMRWPGEQWMMDVNFAPMQRADAEEWIAFMNELRGSYGSFLMGDPAGETARGALGGTPLVKGAGQAGYNLIIDGLTNSVTNWGRKGDYFSVGSGLTTRLHKLTKDCNSNGSGEATLEFVPVLREAPADNAPVTFSAAKGVFRMESPQVNWSVAVGQEYGLSFRALEVI